MRSLLLLSLLVVSSLAQLLPWEISVMPDDDIDEDQKKVEFQCLAECFDVRPAKPQPGSIVTTISVQPHCDRKSNWMRLQRFLQTKIFVSKRAMPWISGYSFCRKYSMEMLSLSSPGEDAFVNKFSKQYRELDAFWLGASDLALPGKLTWTDSGSELVPIFRRPIGGPPTGRCLEAKIYAGDIVFARADCGASKRVVCAMQPECLKTTNTTVTA